ncbi:MAG: ATP-binding cassette domain-containing protein [Candidatus Peregrinibacteria bacterium]
MSAIKVRYLRKKYGDFEALRGISFDVNKGEIVGFLGPNGAGKTTTVKILTCYMGANAGEASVAGHDCFTHPVEVRKRVGYLPENNPLYTPMAVYEYLEYTGRMHDLFGHRLKERIKTVAQDCGLIEKITEFIGNLSKGFRQRVGLAAAMIHDPDVLILDEPTVGLDPNQIIEIRSLIRKLGEEKTVVLCSHRLSEVELTCDRVIIIDLGKIVASGTPVELRRLVDDQANLRLTIRGNMDRTMEVLRQVEGVKKIEVYPVQEKGARGYDIYTARNRDLRAMIAARVIANDLQLLDMHRKVATLEDVFSQVTARVE